MPRGRIAAKAGRARKSSNVDEFVVDVGITERLKKKGVTTEEVFRIVAPRRTLDRRKAEGGKLSLAESDRALRLERVAEHAERVFGNPQKAHRWLRKPNRALDGAIPMDLLTSETGAYRVDEILHRIDFGMYS